jgi:hypothetical protein
MTPISGIQPIPFFHDWISPAIKCLDSVQGQGFFPASRLFSFSQQKVYQDNYGVGLGWGAGESGGEPDERRERRSSSNVKRASRPELVSNPFDRLVSA